MTGSSSAARASTTSRTIDLEIPRDQLVVITGLSGSGKSSLAFDTIYAEGQRRYVESLSAYARQFLEQMEKPEVDSIEGLSPAISIEQKTTSKNPRSTVGTVTEIYDYLRVLFARVGVPHCPACGRVIAAQTVQQMVDRILRCPRARAPRPRPRGPGPQGRVPQALRRPRSARDSRACGSTAPCTSWPRRSSSTRTASTPSRSSSTGWSCREELGARLADSLETALSIADGVAQVEPVTATASSRCCSPSAWPARSAASPSPRSRPACSPSTAPTAPARSAAAWAPAKRSIPSAWCPNPERRSRQGRAGGVGRGASPCTSSRPWRRSPRHAFALDTPWGRAEEERARSSILYGERDGGCEGVVACWSGATARHTSEEARREIEQFMAERPCPACGGGRLRPESLARQDRRALHRRRGASLTVSDAAGHFFDALTLTEREATIARRVLKEVRERLGFLLNVGLDYLTLDRPRPPCRAARASASGWPPRSARAWWGCSTSSTSRRSACTSGTTGGSSTP